MCERREALTAVTGAADELAAACLEHGERQPLRHRRPTAQVLRLAFEKSAATPDDMLRQMRRLK